MLILCSENAQAQKLKKRLRAIGREIQAVEDGLNSVETDAEGEPTEAQTDPDGLQNTGKQGDLQRATMLARLSALRAKQSQLQVRRFKPGLSSMLSACCTCNIWSSLQELEQLAAIDALPSCEGTMAETLLLWQYKAHPALEGTGGIQSSKSSRLARW